MALYRLSCCTGQNGCEEQQYTCILSLLIITQYWIYRRFTNMCILVYQLIKTNSRPQHCTDVFKNHNLYLLCTRKVDKTGTSLSSKHTWFSYKRSKAYNTQQLLIIRSWPASQNDYRALWFHYQTLPLFMTNTVSI